MKKNYQKNINSLKKVTFKQLVAILVICTIFTLGVQSSQNITSGAIAIGDVNTNDDSMLTEEQLLRIEEMAKDNSYIRDADEFSSYEAYEKYLELRGENNSLNTLNSISLNNGSSIMSTSSAVGKSANLAVTLNGLTYSSTENMTNHSSISSTIQTFYIGTSYVYTVQQNGTDVYLSRLTLSSDKKTATFKDQMKLTNFGHCQTLEYFEWNGKSYFWMSCKDDGGVYKNENNVPYYWSLQIARVPYEAGKTYSYTNFKRLCYINKANASGTAYGTTKRCDAALSSDKNTLLIWSRNTDNQMQFSRYNMTELNTALDNNSSMYVSCANSQVKAACEATFTPAQGTIFANAETNSMQGLELNNANRTFIANGPNNQNKYIVKVGTTGNVLKTIKINNTNLLEGTNTEIEGLQLKGDYVYFGICDHDIQWTGVQYIYSMAKSDFD